MNLLGMLHEPLKVIYPSKVTASAPEFIVCGQFAISAVSENVEVVPMRFVSSEKTWNSPVLSIQLIGSDSVISCPLYFGVKEISPQSEC